MSNEAHPANIDDLISDFSRFYILTILYEGPAHGYSIINQFKKRVKKEISPSLVYPFLQQLEEKGLVTHTKKLVGEKEKKSSNSQRKVGNCARGSSNASQLW